MLQQIRAWIRRRSKHHIASDATSLQTSPNLSHTDPKTSPPPYESLGVDPRVLTPFAQHDPALAASYNASLTASAITARAIAEGPDTASAMERGLRLIHTAVGELIQTYGVEHDHRLVAAIWAGAISASSRTASDIAQSPDPSYAIDFARQTEADLADGSSDALILYALNAYEAFSGVRFRHKASTELRADQKCYKLTSG